jgi:hypothetical protein
MVAVGTRISLRPPGRRRRSPAPGSHRTWRADFPHHALRQLIHSFHCYLFKFRFHGPQSTISQYGFHPVIRPFSPLRLGRSYKLVPERDGSPLFTLLPLVACWRYEPREHLRPLAMARAAIPPSPLRDRVGYSDHDRFQPPCLRFATAVTGRHARLGSRLLARLCRGRHRRRQTSTRLQGATRTDPYEPNSGIRLPPWVSNGEAILWPRMKDSRLREPVVGQPLDPLPGRPVFLAPLP